MLSNVTNAFQVYFAMILAVNKLALERTGDDALRLIELRRELAQKTIDVQRAVDEFIRVHGISEADVPLLREHRTMFSGERGSVSKHQAKWNAPAVQANRNAYEKDVRALFQIHEDNHRWRMQILVPALKIAIAK